jgi:ATP-dependent DNA helicase UvrD/PcrA
MDKRIIFSVAGSGKTSLIIDKLNIENHSLIITYTENNRINLRNKIIEKFHGFPENIKLYSYFTFLYSFCYKPFLSLKINAKGFNWNIPPRYTMRLPRTNIKYYLDENKRLYHNRLAKLLEQRDVFFDINQRLEKYFDNVFVDEVQDFGGHDFNLLASICKANIEIVLVGDYFQHTFDTSRDGAVNRNLHEDYENYKARFEAIGVTSDTDTLSNSYRCSPTVCNFISDNLGISISSHRSDDTLVNLIEDMPTIEEKFNCNDTVKLFYQEHRKYPCFSQNWGGSKGQDHYKDVCVVLNNNTYNFLKAGTLHKLKPQTKNKLYVACTRTRNNLYLVSDKHLKKYKQ